MVAHIGGPRSQERGDMEKEANPDSESKKANIHPEKMTTKRAIYRGIALTMQRRLQNCPKSGFCVPHSRDVALVALKSNAEHLHDLVPGRPVTMTRACDATHQGPSRAAQR
ncbi:hypothetical protein SVAN01_08384 [Stagonosporopsis vannaccii]|nr:hypothetical protein SVAN01_08384 [Stagonosporopsis vannaccii]